MAGFVVVQSPGLHEKKKFKPENSCCSLNLKMSAGKNKTVTGLHPTRRLDPPSKRHTFAAGNVPCLSPSRPRHQDSSGDLATVGERQMTVSRTAESWSESPCSTYDSSKMTTSPAVNDKCYTTGG